MTRRWSDDAFMHWCASRKSCKYCDALFVGPVCACERISAPRLRSLVTQQPVPTGSPRATKTKRSG